MNCGIIGLSEGNGHPYSFSAILNGYNPDAAGWSRWPGIKAYLSERSPADFHVGHARVTHVWTQDPEESKRISEASKVPHVVSELKDMIGQVDAVILARDDHQTHYPLSEAFLRAGIPMFIDKPLSLNPDEWSFFRPYLENGQLFSCSGMRYARELDPIRSRPEEIGSLKLARGAVIKRWDTYGIHLLDGIFGVVPCMVERVRATQQGHFSVTLEQTDGSTIQLDALENAPLTFLYDFWGDRGRFHAEVKDFYTAFRRSLWAFVEQVKTKSPSIPPDDCLKMMKILVAANMSRTEGRTVELRELKG